MITKTYKIYTLGCKVNQYDTNEIKQKLNKNYFLEVEKNASLSIINTCCVTKSAIQKNQIAINKAKRENPNSRIAIAGCWPQVYNTSTKILQPDFIINNNIEKIIKKITNKVRDNNKILNSKIQKTKSKTRYFLKIQDGCEQYCSYCVIPFTRGKLRSKKPSEVINETKNAINCGYQEIVLCGIHLGLYNEEKEHKKRQRGAEGGFALVNLLKQLIKLPKLGRIRLSSIEITEVNNNLIKLIQESDGKICKHLHISLQSGCDKILKLMNRPYSTTHYKNKINYIFKLMPDFSFTTDIIVGFPGETTEDFNKTIEFTKKIKFSKIHTFSFSLHKKTAAFNLKNKVNQDTTKTRSKTLRELSSKLEKNYKKRFNNKIIKVLIEGKIKNNKLKAKSEYYFDTYLENNQINCAQIGKIINTRYKAKN